MIDPGPDVPRHVRAVATSVDNARSVTIVLTHGHADHTAAAPALAAATGARIVGPEGVTEAESVLRDGDVLPTDAGDLTVVRTPGHTPEHVCLHLAAAKGLFVGDLFLGVGDTTWVAEYPGCVADYLASLERVRRLDLETLYPAHGPPLTDAAEAIDRFEGHRLRRIDQAREALAGHPDATIEQLLDVVYGPDLHPGLRGPAARSLGALADYVRAHPA